MNYFTQLFKYLWIILWYGFAFLSVFSAAAFGLLHLTLPLVGQYSTQVEKHASEFVGQAVKVQSLDAEWHGFGPSLVFNGVRLLDKSGKKTIVQFSKVLLGFDVLGSLINRQVNFSSMSLIGANLSFVRLADGKITLADFDLQNKQEDESANGELVSKWLLGQGRLSVQINNLLFEDRVNAGKMYHFADVNATLRNSGEQHFIDATVNLPNSQEHEMTVALNVEGNPLSGETWSSDFYLTGTSVNFAKMLGVQKIADRYVALGESSFELWGGWRDNHLEYFQGELSAQDIVVSMSPDRQLLTRSPTLSLTSSSVSRQQDLHAEDTVALEQLTGRFQWQRTAGGWHLMGDRFVISRNGWIWPATRFDVDYALNAQQQISVKANANFLRLHDLAALHVLAKFDDKALQGKLEDIEPYGDLQDVDFTWHEGQEDGLKFHARFENISVNPLLKIPGIEGLRGTLDAGFDYGVVDFDTDKARIYMPRVFRDEQQIQRILGRVYWYHEEGAWNFHSDDLTLNSSDVHSRAVFDLDVPDNGDSPFLSLVAQLSNGNGLHAEKYYPYSILHDKTLEWLDAAIVDGHVTSGGVVFHGAIHDFPFRHNEGVFEAQFNLEKGVLDYVPGWPQIDNISADVVFRNSSMQLSASTGSIFRSSLSDVVVNIPDFREKPLPLQIQGKVQGSTEDKLWYLQSSPALNARFGKYLQDITAQGDSAMDLQIDLQLGPEVQASVTADLQLDNNTLALKPVGQVLDNLNGRLNIRPEGIYADALTGALFGQASNIKVETKADPHVDKPKGNSATAQQISITAEGEFDARDMSQRYLPVVKDLVDGKSAWHVGVDIPYQQSNTKADNSIDVTVESNLNGVALYLPKPFTKDKNKKIKTRIKAMLFKDQRDVLQVEMGGLLDGVAELHYKDDTWQQRGEIRFGGGPVALPERDGMQLSGRLEELNLDVWRNLVKQVQGQLQTPGEAAPAPQKIQANISGCCDWLQSANLSIDDMTLFGQSLTTMRVSALNKESELVAKLKSKQMAGTIKVPHNLQHTPIDLSLDYWHLTSSSATSTGELDPREIPAIKAFSKSVTYKERNFGSVRLETTRLADGLRLEQLVVKPTATTITANGQWTLASGQQHSEFALQLNSTDLGKTLNDLKYQDSIDGGQGTINANIAWPGSLTSVDVEHVTGAVNLDFSKGRLLEVEAGGAGRRIFGLFSLQTLPRRLILDFSDLFKKGFEFNEIKGDFNITQGDAYTNNFYLDGPGVKAEMSGRIGLAAQDYDQKVLVTPRVSDITALLTLLSSEPLLFFLQQLLKDKINKVASFEYKLTGPWENYKLEPVKQEASNIPTDDMLP